MQQKLQTNITPGQEGKRGRRKNKIRKIIYLLVSTHAVIGQFSGPYSPVRPAKI